MKQLIVSVKNLKYITQGIPSFRVRGADRGWSRWSVYSRRVGLMRVARQIAVMDKGERGLCARGRRKWAPDQKRRGSGPFRMKLAFSTFNGFIVSRAWKVVVVHFVLCWKRRRFLSFFLLRQES
jgi:hypothetical protein